ncbi:MAG: LON peptidase substrate-binding domain-containing protein [Leptospiraceae bacterium]|nr:LON peptidase substrate-binding domain-containing protein [Leptospiraceae bacterium]
MSADSNAVPVFPLQTVLFPCIPLQLYIFEERYKEMMAYCLADKIDFVVALIKEGQEALGPLARIHLRGCTARILDVERLAGGRMQILAQGKEIVQLSKVYTDRAYMRADLTPVAFSRIIEAETEAATGDKIKTLLRTYYQLVAGDELSIQRLPEDTISLAYIAAHIVQIPLLARQQLLFQENQSDLVSAVINILQEQIGVARAVRDHKPQTDSTNFGLN